MTGRTNPFLAFGIVVAAGVAYFALQVLGAALLGPFLSGNIVFMAWLSAGGMMGT